MDYEGKSPEKTPTKKIVYDAKAGRANGVKRKFVRARELHKYLFYLTRDYNGKAGSRDEMLKLSKKQGFKIGPEVEKELQNIDVFQTGMFICLFFLKIGTAMLTINHRFASL